MDSTGLPSRRDLRDPAGRSVMRRGLLGAGVLLAVAALVGALAVVVLGPQDVLDRVGLARESTCPRTTVTLSAAPGIAPTLETALAAAGPRRLPDGSCLGAQVVAQPPADALAGFQVLPRDRWPQLWVPDSSVWAAQGQSLDLDAVARLATSPVVLATSAQVVKARGWDAKPPTWAQAMTSGLPFAAPDLAGSSETLSALVALRATTGAAGERAVAAAALASERVTAASVEEALEPSLANAADAALVAVSEQLVSTQNEGVRDPTLSAVYPVEGSPVLDYPLLEVGAASWTPATRAAADVVRSVLGGQDARTRLADAGFRDAAGTRPPGSTAPETVRPLEVDTAAQLEAVTGQLRRLLTPTRMIVVMDVSASMKAEASPGLTRIALVQAAAGGALKLLPDTGAVGVWTFAGRREDRPPWDEVVPLRLLGERTSTTGQRQAVGDVLGQLPRALRADGTGLYATALAAVQRAREEYDARSSNVVVLLTDGANEDPRGPTLAETVAQLRVAADQPPIRLIAVGISEDADMKALERLTAATPNGKAYRALDPTELSTVLFDALSSRT